MRNKNSNNQGRSLNTIEVISILKGTTHKGKNSGSEFVPLREVPILKRDAIEENNCLIQSPLDVRNFFSVLATHFVTLQALILQQIIWHIYV